MIKVIPHDPNDPRFKNIKSVKVTGNRIDIEIDPEYIPEPKPGRPIPPEDRR